MPAGFPAFVRRRSKAVARCDDGVELVALKRGVDPFGTTEAHAKGACFAINWISQVATRRLRQLKDLLAEKFHFFWTMIDVELNEVGQRAYRGVR